ncbi:ferredoxin [bacterium]|nr:ferredoxin [bacterium]
MKKIIQDQSKCIGCLACVGLHPELFAADETTGLAKMIDAKAEGSIYSRELDDSADVEVLPGACCGGAISMETT